MRRALTPSPRIILAVLSLGGISYALLQSLVVPALPQIQDSLHTTESAVGWVLTAYLLSASVATLIIGRLGDMYGKERLLMIVLLALALGTLISAVASSLSLMIVGRVIQGAGGGIFPLAFSIIRDEFPSRRVPGAIGLVSSLLGIGGGAGVVMAEHRRFSVESGVEVYFCDPQSPWQRGSNENTNGLLRQYFPKGQSLAGITQERLDEVADKLNRRPRKTLGFQTPAEKLAELIDGLDNLAER